MKISTASTSDKDSGCITKLYEKVVTDLEAEPDLLMLSCSASYDIEKIAALLTQCAPGIPLHGGTSCMGVMTDQGPRIEDGFGMALFAIHDPGGSYGVGAVSMGRDPRNAAQKAVTMALENAECPGQVPGMIWLTSAPGREELLIDGIGKVVGKNVPVTGGSTGDNSVSGEWKQICNDQIYSDGVVVTTLFPSTEIMFAFHSGYEPTDVKGIITKAGGFEATDSKGIATKVNKRKLVEIDNKPAAQVYNEWTKGVISDQVDTGGNILNKTSLHPLGRVAGHISDIPYYRLAHPDAVLKDGSLTLFSDVEQGEEIVLMKGTVESLISRAGRVATSAIRTYSARPEDIAGALVVYCAGCMLEVKDRLDEVVDSFQDAVPGIPFLGKFTFGEQGCFISGENHHGNLMISVLLFRQ